MDSIESIDSIGGGKAKVMGGTVRGRRADMDGMDRSDQGR